jgi:hypothetical protein
MKARNYLMLFILGTLLAQNRLIGQQIYSLNEFSHAQNESTRKVYFYAGIGLLEWLSLGLGYQINHEFSVSLKHSNVWVSGHGGSNLFPPYASGIGIDIKYFKNLWVFNNLSFNYIYFLYIPNIYDNTYGLKYKGNYYEVNLGNEKIENELKGKLQLFWSLGLGVSYSKNYAEKLILPSIKIGIIHNLF